jgi:hypothetical protein
VLVCRNWGERQAKQSLKQDHYYRKLPTQVLLTFASDLRFGARSAFSVTDAGGDPSGKDYAFVLNQTPVKGFRVRDTAKGLAVFGVLADVAVVTRTDHQDAIGAGQA